MMMMLMTMMLMMMTTMITYDGDDDADGDDDEDDYDALFIVQLIMHMQIIRKSNTNARDMVDNHRKLSQSISPVFSSLVGFLLLLG